jgi:hypothetical protein
MTKTSILTAAGVAALLLLSGCTPAALPSPGETAEPSPTATPTNEPAPIGGALDDAFYTELDRLKAAMGEWDAAWFGAGCPAYDAGDTASAECRELLPAAIDIATATDDLFGDLVTNSGEFADLDPLRSAAEYGQWRGDEWYAAGCDAAAIDDTDCAWATWDLVDDLGYLQAAFLQWSR